MAVLYHVEHVAINSTYRRQGRPRGVESLGACLEHPNNGINDHAERKGGGDGDHGAKHDGEDCPASRASMSTTMSPMSQSRPVSRPAMAGDMRTAAIFGPTLYQFEHRGHMGMINGCGVLFGLK
jgi:hypothetical protein